MEIDWKEEGGTSGPRSAARWSADKGHGACGCMIITDGHVVKKQVSDPTKARRSDQARKTL